MFRKPNSRNWYTTIIVDGKRKTVSLKTSDRKTALLAEQKLRIKVAEGKALDKVRGSSLTVNWLLDKYMIEHSKPFKKSHKDDIGNAKPIRRHIGCLKLTDIKPSVLSAYEGYRAREGVKHTTTRLELALLSHAFTLSLRKWELIEVNPFDRYSLPPASKTRIRMLSADEEKRLFAAMVGQSAWMVPVVHTLRETGARVTNVLTLKWSQIDLRRRTILFPETKSGKPLALPMTEKLLEVLLAHREEQRGGKVVSIDGYLFPRNQIKDGQPRDRNSFNHSFRRLVKRAGIIDLRPHDLRHDCAARLATAGVPLRVIKEWLGHADIKTTMKYAHLADVDAALAEAAKKLGSQSNNEEKRGAL